MVFLRGVFLLPGRAERWWKMKTKTTALWIVLSSTLLPITASASVLYSNDFEGAIGSEWSHISTSTTPIGNRNFLGEFNPETVAFALNDLPTHSELSVSFDLFILRSWDGDNFTADTWDCSVLDGITLLHTTFNNHSVGSVHFPVTPTQSYPDNYPSDSHPSFTGAAEICTLGYTHPSIDSDELQDAVYNLTLTFPHSASSIILNFATSLNEEMDPSGVWDESWGLDNFVLTPEPATLLLLSFGGLFLRTRFRAK